MAGEAELSGKARARVVAFIAWQESTDFQLLVHLIESLHCEAAISPLHDADVYDEWDVQDWRRRHVGRDGRLSDGDASRQPSVGDRKKPHWHVILCFKGNKSRLQLHDHFRELGVSYFMKVESKSGYLRYLIHADSPDKAQYSPADVLAFGGIDLSCLTAMGKLEELDMVRSVLDLIHEGRVTNYSLLVDASLDLEDVKMFDAVVSRCGFFTAYLSSYAARLSDQEHHTVAEFDRTFRRSLRGVSGDVLRGS